MAKKFKNRENEHIVLDGDRHVWLSRSNTVAAQVCLFNKEDGCWYVLLNQRGPNTPDAQGLWNFPCGYLDWDETLAEAMVREVWEECGLYLPDLAAMKGFNQANCDCVKDINSNEIKPWYISDKLRGIQNITFHYSVLINWESRPFPKLSPENCEPGEVSDIDWVKIESAKSMDLAFSHNERLLCLLEAKSAEFHSYENL
jgi:8-oxo-dGTP pyrophosphatase MutT (NUDIX family)